MVGAPAGANAAERIQEHITKTWEEVTGATAAPSAASGTAISATEAVLEMSTPGPQGEEDQEKDEEEEPEADYDRDLSPEPESRAGETRAAETSHGTPDIDMEPLPGGGEEAAFPEPEQEGPPSAERLLILRALGGVRVSEKGQINVEDVGWNLMPWNLLMNIRKEVAKEMQLDMSNPFGYAATQACLTKYRSLVWTACEKSKEGRWWMTKWPWQVVDQPRRPEPGPGDLNAHQQKNVMQV